MTSATLGASAGVSESTVVRLAQTLGYRGFPAFQAALQERIQNELTATERLSITEIVPGPIYQAVFSEEVDNMNRTLQLIDNRTFDLSVRLLSSSRRVIVAGFHASSCLASYAGYSLSKVRSDVHTVRQLDENAFGTVQAAASDDVALLFAFPRYASLTVEIARLLTSRHVPIIGIGDSMLCDIAPLSKIFFTAPLRFTTLFDPFAAPMALAHALAMAVAYTGRDRANEQLQAFESYARATRLFTQAHAPYRSDAPPDKSRTEST